MTPYPLVGSQQSPPRSQTRTRPTHHLEKLTRRLAELFRARVCVLDAEETVLASTEEDWVGCAFSSLTANGCPAAFRVPFQIDAQAGEIAVCELGDRERISPRLAHVLIEMILAETAAHRELSARSETKNKFIYDLLHGHIRDEATILHYAELLRLDLYPPRTVILIDAHAYIIGDEGDDEETGPASPQQAQRRAQYIIDTIIRFFHLPDDLICAYLGGGEIAVLKASDRQNLAAWADDSPGENGAWADLTALRRAADALLDRLPVGSREKINIGLGRYHPGLTGLADSYADAQTALSLGRRFHKNKRIHWLAELGVVAFVGISDEETKLELAEHLLSPLNEEPELLQTLEQFFAEDCSLSLAAAGLSIHRNTLSYRLDKITSLTGLDPRRFDDAVQIRLALMLRLINATQSAQFPTGNGSCG